MGGMLGHVVGVTSPRRENDRVCLPACAREFHAHLACLHTDEDALGLQVFFDGGGDLYHEALLELRAFGELFYQARKRSKPRDVRIRQVGDVDTSKEGDDVVRAERVVGRVTQNDGAASFNLRGQWADGRAFLWNEAFAQEFREAKGGVAQLGVGPVKS